MANTEEIAGVMFYIQVCKLLTNTLSVYPQPPSHPHSSVYLSFAFLQPHRLLAQPFLHLHMVSSIHASIIGGSSLHMGSYCSLQNFQPQSVSSAGLVLETKFVPICCFKIKLFPGYFQCYSCACPIIHDNHEAYHC